MTRILAFIEPRGLYPADGPLGAIRVLKMHIAAADLPYTTVYRIVPEAVYRACGSFACFGLQVGRHGELRWAGEESDAQ